MSDIVESNTESVSQSVSQSVRYKRYKVNQSIGHVNLNYQVIYTGLERVHLRA